MKAIIWDGETLGALSMKKTSLLILLTRLAEYREKLIEMAVEQDEDAMEQYLEGNEPDDKNTVKPVSVKEQSRGEVVPVLCGTAFKNKGVQPMLMLLLIIAITARYRYNGWVKVDDADEEMDREPDDDAPFSALAFKIMNDPFVGSLTFARIYSGVLKAGLTFKTLSKVSASVSVVCF